MKCYKVTGGDLFAVSLVEDPAIESNFIALSKEKQIIQLENEKRLLVGAALIPNKPIYRNINGKEFYISFDEATIEKLAQDFQLMIINTILLLNIRRELMILQQQKAGLRLVRMIRVSDMDLMSLLVLGLLV